MAISLTDGLRTGVRQGIRLSVAARSAYDAAAVAYFTAVEAADGQTLETGVKVAINNFIVGCKADGTWNAIKASCILAGARTLSGALVPLVGTAPTNFNFVSGDYNRKTGLGDPNNATKYLTSGFPYNGLASNNEHIATFISTPSTGNIMGGGTTSSSITRLGYIGGTFFIEGQSPPDGAGATASNYTNFIGSSRSSGSNFVFRRSGSSITQSINSVSRSNVSTAYGVFCANYSDAAASGVSRGRFAFYSIGESLDLALLDARVTALITAFGTAIP